MDVKTLQMLAATAEVMGVSLSNAALDLLADDLSEYDSRSVQTALSRLRKDGARFTPGEIIKRLPGMWPGAEQAWAQFPKDESESACVCQEMLTAWGVCEELDDIAARMAFKETYNRLVSEAMSEGKRPVWTMTLGQDPLGREQATLNAITSGLLTVDAAAAHVPHIPKTELHLLANKEVNANRLLEKHAQTMNSMEQVLLTAPERTEADIETAREHMQSIKEMLGMAQEPAPPEPAVNLPAAEAELAEMKRRNQADMDFRKRLYGA